MPDLAYVDVELNQEEPFVLGNLVEGELLIIPAEDIDVAYCYYEVLLEVRGLLETEVYNIQDKKMLLTHKVLEKEKEHRFPISLMNDQYPTYKGKNVELLVMFESTIKLHQEESKNKILSKIGYKKDGKKITSKLYLNYVSEQETIYNFSEGKTTLKLKFMEKYNELLGGIFIFLVFLNFMTGFFEQNSKFLVGIIGFVILFWLSYHLSSRFFIGKIKAEFKDSSKKIFEVCLENSNSWQRLKGLEISYSIYEEVIDNRGTSPSKSVKRIYRSQKVEKNKLSESLNVEFPYPKKTPSVKFKDVRIFWLLKIVAETHLGLSYIYTTEIDFEENDPL